MCIWAFGFCSIVFETDVEVQACLIDGAGAFIAVNVTENR